MQCACAMLSSEASLVLLYFSTLTKKMHDFRKRLLNIKCVCPFPINILSEKLFILRRTERGKIKNMYWSACKVPLFLSDFNDS